MTHYEFKARLHSTRPVYLQKDRDHKTEEVVLEVPSHWSPLGKQKLGAPKEMNEKLTP